MDGEERGRGGGEEGGERGEEGEEGRLKSRLGREGEPEEEM